MANYPLTRPKSLMEILDEPFNLGFNLEPVFREKEALMSFEEAQPVFSQKPAFIQEIGDSLVEARESVEELMASFPSSPKPKTDAMPDEVVFVEQADGSFQKIDSVQVEKPIQRDSLQQQSTADTSKVSNVLAVASMFMLD